jgi:hypothetical protein
VDIFKFMKIFRRFLLRMKNVSNKTCRENQNAFIFNDFFFFLENRVIYEMWKNMEEPERTQTIWRLHVAY